MTVNRWSDIFRDLSLQQMWPATGKPNNLNTPSDFTACVIKRLAMFSRDYCRQFVRILLKQNSKFLQYVGSS